MPFDRQAYFIKELVAFMKLTDTFEILDPETQQPLGVAKEEPPGWAKWLRLLLSKRMLPTIVNVYEGEGQPPAFSIHKPFTFIRSKVIVQGPGGQALGYFKSKFFTFGGGFWVYDMQDRQVAEVKGDWKGWNFTFLASDGRELGKVTKKWAGVGKELFTSADNYIISLTDLGDNPEAASMLLLAAGLAIDIVYKEDGDSVSLLGD